MSLPLLKTIKTKSPQTNQKERTMQPQNANVGHGLYMFYETLSYDIQQQFLQELLQKQADKLEVVALYLACKEAKEENDFLTNDEEIAFISSLPQ